MGESVITMGFYILCEFPPFLSSNCISPYFLSMLLHTCTYYTFGIHEFFFFSQSERIKLGVLVKRKVVYGEVLRGEECSGIGKFWQL